MTASGRSLQSSLGTGEQLPIKMGTPAAYPSQEPRHFQPQKRDHLKQVFDALRVLVTLPDPPKQPIGFVTPENKGKNASEASGKT